MNIKNRDNRAGLKVGHPDPTFSANELAQILDRLKRAVTRRASRENWHFEETKVRGGSQRRYLLSSLPNDVRQKVMTHLGEVPWDLVDCVPHEFKQEKLRECLRIWDAAPEHKKEKARSKLEVVKAFHRFKAKTGCGIRPFLKLYARRTAGVDPEIYGEILTLSLSTLAQWDQRFRDDGIAGLLSLKGSSIPKTRIPYEQQKHILGLRSRNPFMRTAHIVESLEASFGKNAVSRSAVRRFLRLWESENPALVCFQRSPDEYKSRFQFALGSASEKAQYFLHYVEVDSTPADVMCSDNRRYTIVGLIDLFSRKCQFIVSPTSSSDAIAALIRKTVMSWGIPENLIRDNGKDYRSNSVNMNLEALGVAVHTTLRFSPEQKPHIERLFWTLAMDLEERLPGYVGHNVAERKRIENRRTFAQRFARRSSQSSRDLITLPLSFQELQNRLDWWAEELYHHRIHSGIGMTPNEKAVSVPSRPKRIDDPRVLDILLAVPQKPIRRIGKKGVRFENGRYWSPEFIGRAGEWVEIRYELQDAGTIYCFHPETKEFIGIAEDLELSGLTVMEKIAAKKASNALIREQIEALKVLAKKTDPLAELTRRSSGRESVRNVPTGYRPEDLKFVNGVQEAVDQERRSECAGENHEEEANSGSRGTDRRPEDFKIVPLGIQGIVERPEQESEHYGDPLERFEYLRAQKAARDLTIEEIEWLIECREDWEFYALDFVEQWSESDQKWLARIDPDLFGFHGQREE